MIRYALRCARDHAFESWFRDSAAYDDQHASGLVTCPVCGSADVAKSLMAPSVVTSRRKAAVPEPRPEIATSPAVSAAPVRVPVPEPLALLDERTVKVRALMRELREHVIRTSDDVGAAFPEQARKMHEGEIEHRSIRGEASPAEVRALIEDGVDIMPLPGLPDDRN